MRKKIFLYTLAAIAVGLSGITFYEIVNRCTKDGLAYGDALQIAQEKLSTDFDHGSFRVSNERLDEFSRSWTFTFSVNSCIIDIIVDKCGVSDVGGITEACIPFQK